LLIFSQLNKMKNVSVADFKAQFSDLLELVRRGEQIAIQYGRRKQTVAVLGPPPSPTRAPRKLGVLKGKASFKILPGFKMTDEELLGE
jgi:antitoxin (DNA-binding transcriptional repressor) of toxin-antitoxin stability system